MYREGEGLVEERLANQYEWGRGKPQEKAPGYKNYKNRDQTGQSRWSFGCNKVRDGIQNVDEIVKQILIKDLTETRDLTGWVLVGELVEKKERKADGQKEPWWKRRIEGDILTLCKI